MLDVALFRALTIRGRLEEVRAYERRFEPPADECRRVLLLRTVLQHREGGALTDGRSHRVH